MGLPQPSLPSRCVAEAFGTFVLVFFGCGAVHAAVLAGAQSGLWQVAVVWGVAIIVATYAFSAISGAHINPAMTLAFWLWRGFPTGQVVPYIASQLVGAALAAGCLFALYEPFLLAREQDLLLVRGQPGSEMTAMCYGEYFPSPGRLEVLWRKRVVPLPAYATADSIRLEALEEHAGFLTLGTAFFAEFLGTLILGFVVFAVTDERNPVAGNLAPVCIGLTVAILISVIAPLTQACFNPARDFGPRTVAWLAGWNDIAWPGPSGWHGTLLVYGAAPVLGAITGGGLFRFLVRPACPTPSLENKP